MRMGIVLSDKVDLVSPSYAKEALQPSKPGSGDSLGRRVRYTLYAQGMTAKWWGF